MTKRIRKLLSFFCCLLMLAPLMPVSAAAGTDNIESAERG